MLLQPDRLLYASIIDLPLPFFNQVSHFILLTEQGVDSWQWLCAAYQVRIKLKSSVIFAQCLQQLKSAG